MSLSNHQGKGAIGVDAEHSLQHQIKAECFRLLYTNSYTTFIGSQITALFLVYLLWDAFSHQSLLIWLGILFTLNMARVALSSAYFKTADVNKNVDRWANIYVYGALLSGIVWGSAGIIFFAPDQIDYQAMLLFALGGLGAGSFAVHIHYLPAFYYYFIPSLLPILLRTLAEGDRPHITMAAWGTSYMVALLFMSKINNRSHIEAIRLRFINQSLLEEVQEEHRLAELANQSKSRFLAAASHDLRQPLYALGLFTQRLYNAKDAQQTHEIAGLIERSFTSLKNLLDSLLDVSKLDAGVITVHKKSFSLQPLFENIIADCTPLAENKGIALHTVTTSAQLYSDPQLIERILRNLVLNAINYTDTGRVTLGVRRRNDQYELQILDTGVGIPAHELANIFQEFHQLNNPERDREKGLGLGLSIVNRLVSLLGSEVKLSSTLRRGSCFSFVIPAGECADTTLPEVTAHTRSSGTRVLVIDDDRLILHATAGFLKPLGYQVLTAEGCDEAIEVLKQHGEQPDLIISDYRLRDNRNGVDAATAICQFLNRVLPVIIVTGDTDPDRIREAASHGFHLLHKPISPQFLHSTISLAMESA